MKLKAFAGITLTLFLVASLLTAIPIRGKLGWDGEIHIAVIGPYGWIQADGQWVGAVIAADKVNLGPNGVDDGGDGDDGVVLSNGDNLKIVLEFVDSHAVDVDPAAGWTELLYALEDPFRADFVIGGFRTEVVGPIREEFIAYAKNEYDGLGIRPAGQAPLWFICGASTNELIDCGGTGACGGTCTRCDYSQGRYMFRNTPMNGTTLFRQLALGALRSYILPTRLYPMYGAPVKTAIVAEGLTWTYGMCVALAGEDFYPGCGIPSPPSPYSLLGPMCDVEAVWRTAPVDPDMDAVFDDLDAKNVRLIIQIYSALTGVDFITTYKDRQTNAVAVGINVESERQEFWVVADGKCEYEAFLDATGTREDVNPDAEPLSTVEFWDEYKIRSGDILTDLYGVAKPSTCPIYTGWGTYDTIIAQDELIESYGSWPIPTDTLIPLFEQTQRVGILQPSGGAGFRYTGPNGIYHDLFVHPEALTTEWNVGHPRSTIVQWQYDETTGSGARRTFFPQDQPYSRRYRVPPWVYALETDLTFDGVVDIDDVMIPALTFGSYPGCKPPLPPWNIEADFTADGLVDIDDVIVVALDFGKYAEMYHESWPLPM